MSGFLKDPSLQKKMMIGVAVAGVGLTAIYGFSRWKAKGSESSAKPPARPTTPPKQIPAEVERTQEALKAEKRKEIIPELKPLDEPKEPDLSVSGTFEKINFPSAETSRQTSRQVSQNSEPLGESFEQVTLSQVQQAQAKIEHDLPSPIEKIPEQGIDSLPTGHESPIEDKFEQITRSQIESPEREESEDSEKQEDSDDNGDEDVEEEVESLETAPSDREGHAKDESETVTEDRSPAKAEIEEAAEENKSDSEEEEEKGEEEEGSHIEADSQEAPGDVENDSLREEDQNDIVVVEKKGSASSSDDFDASVTSPVFFRQNYEKEDATNMEQFNPAISHPAFVGYSVKERFLPDTLPPEVTNSPVTSLLYLPHPLQPGDKVSFGCHLSTEHDQGRTRHLVSNCSPGGLAEQIGIRDGYEVVSLNGMNMENSPNHIVVAFLCMPELVRDCTVELEITCMPVQDEMEPNSDSFSEVTLATTFECRIMIDPTTNEFQLQTTEKQAALAPKENVTTFHKASTGKCNIGAVNSSDEYLKVVDGRLTLGTRQKEENSYLFNLTHFWTQESDLNSKHFKKTDFVMIHSLEIEDSFTYLCTGNRKTVGLLRLERDKNEYLTTNTINTEQDPRCFHHRTTPLGLDYFESNQQKGHFLACDGRRLFLKYTGLSDVKVEEDKEIHFQIKPWPKRINVC